VAPARHARLLPALPVAPLPVWLTVRRKIRSNARIRAAFGHPAAALPVALRQPSAGGRGLTRED